MFPTYRCRSKHLCTWAKTSFFLEYFKFVLSIRTLVIFISFDLIRETNSNPNSLISALKVKRWFSYFSWTMERPRRTQLLLNFVSIAFIFLLLFSYFLIFLIRNKTLLYKFNELFQFLYYHYKSKEFCLLIYF